jgi:hypothetical protein
MEPTSPTDTHPSPARRSPLARLLAALRGDKYMVDAYPPAWHRAAAARAADDVPQPGHDGEVAAGVRAGVASEPHTAAVASRTKEQ